MAHHLELMENAKAAIERLGADTSVPPETTKESLEELAADIEGMLDGLRDDLGED